ncbi:hypothetical protein RUND412_004649 [Rhizina undulata]
MAYITSGPRSCRINCSSQRLNALTVVSHFVTPAVNVDLYISSNVSEMRRMRWNSRMVCSLSTRGPRKRDKCSVFNNLSEQLMSASVPAPPKLAALPKKFYLRVTRQAEEAPALTNDTHSSGLLLPTTTSSITAKTETPTSAVNEASPLYDSSALELFQYCSSSTPLYLKSSNGIAIMLTLKQKQIPSRLAKKLSRSSSHCATKWTSHQDSNCRIDRCAISKALALVPGLTPPAAASHLARALLRWRQWEVIGGHSVAEDLPKEGLAVDEDAVEGGPGDLRTLDLNLRTTKRTVHKDGRAPTPLTTQRFPDLYYPIEEQPCIAAAHDPETTRIEPMAGAVDPTTSGARSNVSHSVSKSSSPSYSDEQSSEAAGNGMSMNSEQQPISVFPNSASRCPPSGVKLPPGLTHPHFIMARGTDQATFTDYGPTLHNMAPAQLRLEDRRRAFETKANIDVHPNPIEQSKVQIEDPTQEAKEEISKAASEIYREGMDTSERKLIAHIHPYNIYTLPGSNIPELSMGELELLRRGVE